MALYVFNISVDAPDIYSQEIREDLTLNDQESIIEIVLEKVLGYEDAISEHEEHDEDSEHNIKKNLSFEWYKISDHFYEEPFSQSAGSKNNFNRYHYLVLAPFFEIQSPPPEV